MRLLQRVMRLAKLGHLIDDRAARIACPKNTGNLVIGLTDRIIHRRTDDVECIIIRHPYQLRMAARDHQSQQRKLQIMIDRKAVGVDMSRHVVDRKKLLVKLPGKCLGRLHTDMERTDQARSPRIGNRIDLIHRKTGTLHSLLNDCRNVFDMDAARHFRHNAAIERMHIDLTGDDAGKNFLPIPYHGACRFVAARFNCQYRCHFLILPRVLPSDRHPPHPHNNGGGYLPEETRISHTDATPAGC